MSRVKQASKKGSLQDNTTQQYNKIKKIMKSRKTYITRETSQHYPPSLPKALGQVLLFLYKNLLGYFPPFVHIACSGKPSHHSLKSSKPPPLLWVTYMCSNSNLRKGTIDFNKSRPCNRMRVVEVMEFQGQCLFSQSQPLLFAKYQIKTFPSKGRQNLWNNTVFSVIFSF